MKFDRKRALQCGVSLSQAVLAEGVYHMPEAATPSEPEFEAWVNDLPPALHDLAMWLPPGSFVCGPGLAVPGPMRVGVVIGYAADASLVRVADLAAVVDQAGGKPMREDLTGFVPPKRLSLLSTSPPATRENVARIVGRAALS